MNLSSDDMDRINSASKHISDSIAKTIEGMHLDLMKHFKLTGRQLNISIARAAIQTMVVCTASAAAADGETQEQAAAVALDIAHQVEAIMWKALGVEL